MATFPSVTIITPVYNGEQYVNRVAQSVLGQCHVDFEWLIVDDCSTDGTNAAFRATLGEDPRVRILTSPVNVGIAAARNVALAHARGEYVCFLDVDDSWAPEKLAVQLRFMRLNAAHATAMDYLRVDDSQRPIGIIRPPARISWRRMLTSNRVGNLTGMVQRSLLTEVHFKNVGHEDYVFWLAIARRYGPILRVPTEAPLCRYTVRSTSASADKLTAAKWQWNVYRSVLGLNFALSCCLFLSYAVTAVFRRMSLRRLSYSYPQVP